MHEVILYRDQIERILFVKPLTHLHMSHFVRFVHPAMFGKIVRQVERFVRLYEMFFVGNPTNRCVAYI